MRIQIWMVQEGHATPYYYKGERNRWADELDVALVNARKYKRGIWGHCRVVYHPEKSVSTSAP
jgi:endonuclease YncB( thermonuclease family)